MMFLGHIWPGIYFVKDTWDIKPIVLTRQTLSTKTNIVKYVTIKPDSSSNSKVQTAYKRIDRKVKPVPAVFPEDAKVTHQFPENPLDTLPELPTNPPEFESGKGLNHENIELLNITDNDFLLPEEKKLFIHIYETQ